MFANGGNNRFKADCDASGLENSSDQKSPEHTFVGKKRKKRKHASLSVPLSEQKRRRLSVIDATVLTSARSMEEFPEAHKLTKSIRKKQHQMLISKFHTLQKQLEAAKHSRPSKVADDKQQRASDSDSASDAEVERIKRELDNVGGLSFYQEMSLRGEKLRHNANSSKWILKQLSGNDQDITDSKAKMKLLDIGALHFHYTQPWIDAIAIDLNPVNARIRKQDFFEMSEDSKFDVICCSLVLNFVGDPVKRGEMILKCCRMLRLNGILMIVLPLPCLENSRFLTRDLFYSMMQAVGFSLVKDHCSKKLFYSMLKLHDVSLFQQCGDAFKKRKNCRQGNQRNNFCILL